MTRPLKKAGFNQGIHEISSRKKEEIGTLRITQDGRKFRYSRAGAGALSAGKMSVGVAADANVINQAMPAAVALGAQSFEYTAGGAVTFAADYFSGGYFQINDAAGEGHQYEIEGNAVVTAGTAMFITLRDKIRVALTTSSEGSLVASPWMGTTESTTEENLPVGIPAVAVTAAYYYWAQTGGPAIALMAGTPAVGTMLTISATAGALAAINATLDIDQPICGIAMYTAGVATEYKPVFLMLD